MKWFLLITSQGPQSGKTTLREHLAQAYGVAHCATSDMLLIPYYHRTGITPDQVRADRAIDPDNHRQGLIDVAEELRDQFGASFTLDAFYTGHQIVDGGRKADEIKKARSFITRSGVSMMHLHLIGRGEDATDNTEPEIAELADVILPNDDTIEDLFARATAVIDDWIEVLGS